ncbi:TolC family protein [Oligoflexus tunisiensis]|uniref:TolC family protein n=1 Tax=Oligoflexus tunisiensis TaxID=708132 RepID=UPI00159EFCD1|nr:TolC family protein [Oligoflexus tunisiensis]
MKYLVLLLSFGTLCVIADEAAARTLTLSEAQSLAAKNNPQVNVLEAEVSEARARLNVTRFQNRPVIGVAGGGQFEGTAKDRDLLPLAYAYAGVNLYNGGQTRIQEDLAEIHVDKVQAEIPFKSFQLRKKIEELFTEIEMRHRVISVKKKEIKAFESHRRKANERRIAGLTGETDVLEFDLRKTNLRNDIETLIAERGAYLRTLSLLTGEPKVDDIEGFSLPEKVKRPDISVAGLTDISPTSRILAKELSGLSLEEKLQSTRWGPRVDLEGRAGFLPKEGDTDDNKARFDIMIVAKMDLFNSLQRNAELQETLMKKKKLQAMITAENVDARFLVDQSLTAMQNQQKKLQILDSNKESAERYYRSTLEEYERGIKNSPDVAHATEILFETEYKAVEIRYKWVMQKIKLESILMREI